MTRQWFLTGLWTLLGLQKHFDALFQDDWLQPIFVCNQGAPTDPIPPEDEEDPLATRVMQMT